MHGLGTGVGGMGWWPELVTWFGGLAWLPGLVACFVAWGGSLGGLVAWLVAGVDDMS